MRNALLVSLLAMMFFVVAPDAAAADAQRGRELYETRCLGCHGQSVHGRAKRVATSFEEISAWVSRWNTSLALNWSADEIEDVSAYLNATYYHFACPPSVCKAMSQGEKKKKPA
jgi:mono/diheme cytochrome c family protein